MPIQRRRLLWGVGAGLASHGCRAVAQTLNAQPRRVGILEVLSQRLAEPRRLAFGQGMQALGWNLDKGVEIRAVYADGDLSRLPELAVQLIAQKVEVIVVGSGAATRAAMAASRSIPVVMVNTSDPVAQGFVASLARPGGNVTGISSQFEDVLGKLIDIVHEVVPAARRLALVLNESSPVHTSFWWSAQRACAQLGLTPIRVAANSPAQFGAAREQILAQRAQAVVVAIDPMFNTERVRLNDAMQATRLPVAYGLREHVLAGGLLSYGSNFTANWGSAAKYVDLLLKGVSAAELPVQQPTRFELVINLGAARALELSLPYSLRLQADEVIE